MASELRHRRGSTVAHSVFTGAVGEITVDTDKQVAVVHDGTTVGGFPMAKQSAVDAAITAAYAEATNVSRIKQALAMQRKDLYVLMQGDSTGNEDTEWYRLMANALAPLYPAYTFKYRLWDNTSTTWGAAVTIQTGTGTKTITFYNGSFSGATPSYWTGSRNQYAYDGKDFDLIMTNYGLNVPDSWRNQAERMAEYLYTLNQQQPQAEILVTIQPPDYTNSTMLDRSANRADAQRMVAGLYGCQVIDAYNLFINLVDTQGGTTPWYIDLIHPTPAGSEKWSELAAKVFQSNLSGGATAIFRPNAAPSGLPNGNFASWLNGTNNVPTFWKVGGGATALRNTIQYETNGCSVRATGAGTGTGTLYLEADEIINRYKHYGDIVVAARIYSQGTSGKSGTLYFAHSVTTAYTEIQNSAGQPSESANGWRWAFLLIPKAFYAGKSNFQLGVFSGIDGEFVSVDRIVICPTLRPNESDLTCSWSYSAMASDSSFSIPTGGVSTRTFSSFVGVMACQKGCKVNVVSPDVPLGIGLSAEVTGVNQITVHLANFTGGAVTMPATTYSFEVSV